MGMEMRELKRREMDVEALARMSLGELLYYVLFGDGRVMKLPKTPYFDRFVW
jgi:hypothetical protein